MGQPVTVIEKPSSHPGVVRYETNRALTGMGHEVFRSLDDVTGDAPADRIARVLFEHGGVEAVHVNANVITVHFERADGQAGVKALIEDLYTYYRPGVEVVVPEGAATE
jgi:sirohydrochlorin ferrochelatase